MAPRNNTRQRMLETAADLFHTQGYHATGLNQLVSAGGAPKGSLYFHFPGGKEQLAAEALAVSGARLCTVLDGLLRAAPDAGTAIESVVQAIAQALVDSDFRRGCPMATVALDAAAASEPIRKACASGYASWRDLIADYLVEQGLDQDRAASVATVVLASIEGGLLLAKTHHDVTHLRAVGEHLRTTVEGELPE